MKKIKVVIDFNTIYPNHHYHQEEAYIATDVDTLLSDVRALVEVSKKFNETGWTQRGWEDLLQKQNEAIAAVERHF